MPHDPRGWIAPESRAAVVADLAALRGVTEVAELLAGGAPEGCTRALVERVQWVVGLAPRVPVEDMVVVALGEGLVPAEVARCALSRGGESRPVSVAVRYRGLTLIRVAPATPAGGPPPRASLLLGPGVVLLGPTEALHATLDAALAHAEGRAEPLALAPLLQATGAPAEGESVALRAVWWSGPSGRDDVFPRVRGVGVGVRVSEGAARYAGLLRCDDEAGAAETARALESAVARDAGAGAVLPPGLTTGATARASGRDVLLEGRASPQALRVLLGAALALAPGRAPSPPTGPRPP